MNTKNPRVDDHEMGIVLKDVQKLNEENKNYVVFGSEE